MAKAAKKVIITCAVTGSIHTPSMSPHLPVTPQQIADNAIGAAEAGAAEDADGGVPGCGRCHRASLTPAFATAPAEAPAWLALR